ncbi:MAG: DNA repair protein RadA, partial [Ectothiorhodospiraceae bacterium]|nr:DNA repair protein RadA [Ectothiorhodospiraceae bacterium]
MARGRTQFNCTACGALSPKWAGQCPECGAWNTMEEAVAAPAATSGRGPRGQYAGDGGARSLVDVDLGEDPRHRTGLDELDRVLGGGLVQGGVV